MEAIRRPHSIQFHQLANPARQEPDIPAAQNAIAQANQPPVGLPVLPQFSWIEKKGLQKGLCGAVARLFMSLFGWRDDFEQKRTQAHDDLIKTQFTSKRPPAKEAFKNGNLPVLPPSQSLAHGRHLIQYNKILNNRHLAERHVENRPHLHRCENLTALDGTAWEALRIDSQGQIIEGDVMTTSERALGNADLFNIYINIDTQNRVTVRCGVIDTEEKAEEFMKALIHSLGKKYPEKDLKGQNLRIVLHQLNSFGNEEKMLKNQKRYAAYMNERLKTRLEEAGFKNVPTQDHIIAHLNRSFNGFHKFPGEKGKSHVLNTYAWAKQAVWLKEDLDQEGSFSGVGGAIKNDWTRAHQEVMNLASDLKKIDELQDQIDGLESIIKQGKEELDPFISQLKLKKKQLNELNEKRLRSDLGKKLKALGEKAKKLSDALSDINKSAKVKLKIFARILEEQTNREHTLTPLQEVGLHILNDIILGAVTEANCKSGLDRTGAFIGMEEVLKKKYQQYVEQHGETGAQEKLYDFILNFWDNKHALHAAFRNLKGNQKEVSQETLSGWIDGLAPELKELWDFQIDCFAELMSVGRPITERSTGIAGMKWFTNKVPYALIPHYVVDSATGKVVKMTTRNRFNERVLTEDGKAVMLALSRKRGA